MKNWNIATQSEIDNMSIDEALEIINYQIASGTVDISATKTVFELSPHFTKALIIMRQIAIDHIEKCIAENINESFDKTYWLNLDTDQVAITDSKTKLLEPYKEISKGLYLDLIKRRKIP
jgi:hypothetical protein